MVDNEPNQLKISDFDYALPEELIAQTAVEPRDSSRLMVLNRADQTMQHVAAFREIIHYFKPGDTLVVNESKVLPARIFGKKVASGATIELLFLHPLGDKLTWEVMVRPGGGTKPGAKFVFGETQEKLEGEVLEIAESGGRIVRFNQPPEPFLEKYGIMPLPPYIRAKSSNPSRYQTVYANPHLVGSAAAPTAGLHFTDELIAKIKAQGVNFEKVILHVGLDTFQPVKVENALEHKIHSEWCSLSADVAERLNATRAKGGRIIAVGTTGVRTLETAYRQTNNHFTPFEGQTNLYLYPGKPIRGVDAMITNFHLPRSTLLMLISAFAGRDFILKAYTEAVKQKYRFFSFGDAMLIL
jgi:S-adenosylmethionine:tRNA ribosyltransferase-isomerase